MNLLYIIPTRGRPLNLLGTLSTAWRLRSGKHALTFAVTRDEDDEGSFNASTLTEGTDMEPVVQWWRWLRPDALGVKWNHPIPHNSSSLDAALLMTDRMIPTTPGWDDVVSVCLQKYPNRVLWWRSPTDPGTVAPVVPRSWLEAMDWKPAVEAYPYWFIDTHLMELDRLIFGGASLMMPCFYAGERKETQQMRDCAFWCRYYGALRPQRIEQAKQIAAKLGVEWTDRPELVAEFASQDAVRIQRAGEFEAVFGDKSEPWEGYNRIKAEAEALMDYRGRHPEKFGFPEVAA